MKRLLWCVGFLVCALLWAWTGCLVVVPLIFWPLSDAHLSGPGEIFLDPSYLSILLPSLAGAVFMTVLIFRDWSQRGQS
jgi:hypothetical protein